MAASDTVPTSAFNADTYRSNEASRKASLKFRIASESTGEDDTGSVEDATNYLAERSRYRLTSQFRRKILERAGIMPSVIDDIKQKFSGIVTGIDYENEEFIARISDLTNPNNPDELVTLGFDEIQEADQRQLTKGDSFVWYIGYVQGQMISREGFSKIRFRRLPAWSQQAIDMASSRAEELAHFFHRDPDTPT
jgi:hypothetical protein